MNEDLQSAEETPATAEPSGRRAELVEVARAATQGRPGLMALLERVAALEDIDLQHHVSELDAVHRALRDLLAAAGQDETPAR